MNHPTVAILTAGNDEKPVIVRMAEVVWAKEFTKAKGAGGTTLMLSNGTTLEVREGFEQITTLMNRGG